jgi:hypothetical protein
MLLTWSRATGRAPWKRRIPGATCSVWNTWSTGAIACLACWNLCEPRRCAGAARYRRDRVRRYCRRSDHTRPQRGAHLSLMVALLTSGSRSSWPVDTATIGSVRLSMVPSTVTITRLINAGAGGPRCWTISTMVRNIMGYPAICTRIPMRRFGSS